MAAVVPPAVPESTPTPGRTGKSIVLPGQTPEGEHILGVLLKRSYAIVPDAPCVRAATDQKLHAGDVHYGDPMNTTVKFESDFVPFKLATDVVLNGRAYAPGGQAVDSFTAAMIVGSHRKDVLVIGDRVARYNDGGTPIFTEPSPFTTMELRYERAYGGVDIYSDPKVQCVYGRNHLGRGFAVAHVRRAVDNLPLPNLEDPTDRLTPERLTIGHFIHWEQQPMPQGFGWFSKYWRPRALMAGVMPADRATERELRAAHTQLVPAGMRPMYDQTALPDMDFRFFNGASPGLVVPYLSGDEPVHTLNLVPEGRLSFALPGERPRIALDIGSGAQEPETVLHTVMIRMEEREVDLVWRAAVPYPGPDWLPQMRKMEVIVQ
jgi:hypothetical protein